MIAHPTSDVVDIQEIEMVGVQNYMTEKCIKVLAGQTVKYSFTSGYPLDFNIHWHTDSETFYEDKADHVKSRAGDFRASSDQHYCFTWINHAEFGDRWVIPLNVTIANP